MDFAIITEGKARYSVEVTSKTASKGGQLAKERRIRQQGPPMSSTVARASLSTCQMCLRVLSASNRWK